jgi:hypothetical protein
MEPGGVTAHPDHMAVSAATQAAFGAYAATAREREPRFYYWGVPVSDMASWRQLGRASGYELPGEDDPYGGRGTPDDQFTCTVDTSTVAEQPTGPVPAPDPGRRPHLPARPPGQPGGRCSPFQFIGSTPPPARPARASLVEAFGNGGAGRAPKVAFGGPSAAGSTRPSEQALEALGARGFDWPTPARPPTWW